MLGNEPAILDSKFEDVWPLVFEQTKKSEKRGSRP